MKSENARDREDAALGLSEHPRPSFEIISVLLDMLKDPDPRRQKQSLDALATHLPTMAPSLIAGYRAVQKLTNSEDAEVRRAATELLRKLPEPDPSKKP
jgi:HEAT repeat protein